MKHPKSENILKVIEVFKSVLLRAIKRKAFNIGESGINCNGHECGTAHCVAGWYAIGSGLHKFRKVDFQDGANRLGQDLGFKGQTTLEDWAVSNNKLWGNKNGVIMFYSITAYRSDKRKNGATNFKHIIDHWQEVYERVKALEDAEKPQPVQHYENISHQLAVMPVNEVPDKVGVDELVTK